LAAQLGLSDGFGLLVDEVLPESPAQTAGVQRYDVLKQLNDQQLAEPSQLAALVRRLGKDADASLTVIRKGQEQKLSIKVGEKAAPREPSARLAYAWRRHSPVGTATRAIRSIPARPGWNSRSPRWSGCDSRSTQGIP
jgi:C-terminal processing protease CtpA/Prc